jgi:mRNA interferase YafQ
MRQALYSGKFKKDVKLMQARGHEINKLLTVIDALTNEEQLAEHYHDHPLKGKYAWARDCHISPDWILIYAIVDDELHLVRTGTHAELFNL